MSEISEGIKLELARLYKEVEDKNSLISELNAKVTTYKACLDFIRSDKYASHNRFKHLDVTIGQYITEVLDDGEEK